MCQYCAPGASRLVADRARVLHLLAMIEHPDALPAEAALRIAGALLAWVGPSDSGLRCEVPAGLDPAMDHVA